ncbi:MAG: DUF4393 domain-containing protein [Clostridium sp.]|uniref:DUF4393 domain-containing protein n=1 Tax=Clostridium sp. TaxID=1506 RepID=UPI002A8AEE66|nr:DUF4393 domain-containing protein [Clostridium sp.]MDY5096686.1 DUF4393 domain-containing protein [Clostridium sp.]
MLESEFLNTAATTVANSSEILKEVYNDVAKPTAQNVGKALGTLSSTINVLLAPISWAVYGFKHIDASVKSKLEEKLSDTPIEELKEPEPNIVIPAYEALRYTLNKEQLKDMYVNLIANSMKISTSNSVHPAFVEVVKQFSVFDADLLKKLFSKSASSIPKLKIRIQKSEHDYSGIDLSNIVLSPQYYGASFLDDYNVSLENLERLKIIEIHHSSELLEPNIYDSIIDLIDKDSFKSINENFPYVDLIKGYISLTNFGKEFVNNIF